jgi:Cys-rich repeat protein
LHIFSRSGAIKCALRRWSSRELRYSLMSVIELIRSELVMNHHFKISQPAALLRLFPILVTFAAAFLDAAPAAAQQACGELTCDKGTLCVTSQVDCGCEGQSCPPDCDFDPMPFCTPASCETADDCASYMVCAASERRVCPDRAPSCEPGESDDDCAARAAEWQAEECDIIEQSICTPRWERQCTSDADCGAGFRCEAPGACALSVEACAGDGDCPEAWTCQSVSSGSCLPTEGEEECHSAQELRCVPPLGSTVTGQDDVARSGSGATSVDDAPAEEDLDAPPAALEGSSAGCSAAGAPMRGSAAWLGALFALGLSGTQRRWRRRRAGT